MNPDSVTVFLVFCWAFLKGTAVMGFILFLAIPAMDWWMGYRAKEKINIKPSTRPDVS